MPKNHQGSDMQEQKSIAFFGKAWYNGKNAEKECPK
jgi:hypothetical protein